MRDAIHLKILIWGPSHTWLEWKWKKNPAWDDLPQKFFLHCFPTGKKISALLVCEEKNFATKKSSNPTPRPPSKVKLFTH